jgi:pimeloyl-ACP methyl ester carboxylesterase
VVRRKLRLFPQLRRLRFPTLVLRGDDDFIPIDVVRAIADAIPGSRLAILPDCGHFAYLEQPERVHAAFAELLSKRRLSGDAPPEFRMWRTHRG